MIRKGLLEDSSLLLFVAVEEKVLLVVEFLLRFSPPFLVRVRTCLRRSCFLLISSCVTAPQEQRAGRVCVCSGERAEVVKTCLLSRGYHTPGKEQQTTASRDGKFTIAPKVPRVPVCFYVPLRRLRDCLMVFMRALFVHRRNST